MQIVRPIGGRQHLGTLYIVLPQISYEASLKNKFPYVRKNRESHEKFYSTFPHIHHYEQYIIGNGVTVFFTPSLYQGVNFVATNRPFQHSYIIHILTSI